MPERWSSLLILLGGVAVVLALWYLSVLAIRWETRRRVRQGEMRPAERKAWVIASIALPLFGFALYLFTRVLRGYFTPAEESEAEPGAFTEVRARTQQESWSAPDQIPMPQPVGGESVKPHTNGKAHASMAQSYQTPATIPASYLSLRTRYVLIVIEGPYTGLTFPIETLPVRLGRGPEANMALDDDLNVSRRHAEVYEWNGTLRIRDLGSSHGTLINGLPIRDQLLNPGDRITMGGSVLILREQP